MTAAKDIQRGSYIRFNNEICQVTRKETATCGTHCHSKTKLFVRGLSSKGEKSFNLGHHESVEELDIQKKTGQVISKAPGKVQLMDTRSYEVIEADADEDVLNEIKEGDEVIFISFEGITRVLSK